MFWKAEQAEIKICEYNIYNPPQKIRPEGTEARRGYSIAKQC